MTNFNPPIVPFFALLVLIGCNGGVSCEKFLASDLLQNLPAYIDDLGQYAINQFNYAAQQANNAGQYQFEQQCRDFGARIQKARQEAKQQYLDRQDSIRQQATQNARNFAPYVNILFKLNLDFTYIKGDARFAKNMFLDSIVFDSTTTTTCPVNARFSAAYFGHWDRTLYDYSLGEASSAVKSVEGAVEELHVNSNQAYGLASGLIYAMEIDIDLEPFMMAG